MDVSESTGSTPVVVVWPVVRYAEDFRDDFATKSQMN
jgi:hypothetical protein